jgi:hypothetical protein
MARAIKLSGREAGVVRTIGFGLGVTGTELSDRLQMDEADLVDVLNTLLEAGYVEAASMRERVGVADYGAETFEVNPSYTSELKGVMRRQ